MKKRALAFMLSLAMVISMLPAAFAEEIITVDDSQAAVTVEEDAATSGTCGDSVTWNYNNGTLTISGTGDMANYIDGSRAPWYSLEKSISSVVIENGVTSIGESAFDYCKSLKSITIPNSVTSIGIGAFSFCTSLKSITIPDSVTSIGDVAFWYCESLESITIPDSVTSIGEGAFYGCTNLKNIYVADNNVSYSSVDGVLFNKNRTELVRYPSEKTDTSYAIPNSVTSIGYGAFWYCESLESITIPDSVTSIGEWAFGSTGLKNVTIPDSVTSIGHSAFSFCTSLESVTIPDSVTEIGEYAFEDCTSLKSITIPDSVTSISRSVFAGCWSLESVDIPNSVTSIGDGAFWYCESLESITIPDSVTSICDGAFYGCTGLKTIKFYGDAPTFGPEYLGVFTDVTATAYYPKGNSTWTDDVKQNYGGNITWKEWDPEIDEPIFTLNLVDKTIYLHTTGNYLRDELWLLNNDISNYTEDEINAELDKYTWTSSDESVISIDGVEFQRSDKEIRVYLTPEAVGKSTITATRTTGETVSCVVTVKDLDVEEELVEKVKLYTSDGGTAYSEWSQGILEICMRDDVPQEAKIRRLNDFYTRFGLPDISCGTKWSNDARKARLAYDNLVNNEKYFAYNFAWYLENTTKGKIARGLMLSDGWIFNGDLKQYVDPKTYITKETNSIKNYKAMLMDFMGTSNDSLETYAQKTVEVLTTGNTVYNDTVIKRLEKELKEATTKDKEATNAVAEKYIKKYGIRRRDEGEFEVYGFEELGDILGAAGKTLRITELGSDTLMTMINMEANLETMSRYEKFLKAVAAGEDFLPYGMVVAAEHLLDDYVNEYEREMRNLVLEWGDFFANDVFDVKSCFKKAISKELQEKCPNILGAASTIGGAVNTIEEAAMIVDWMTSIGSTVKKAAYVQGYACLGVYFSELLVNSKYEFLDEQSVENAWNFYDYYQMLYQIRAEGEKCYVEMSETGKIREILNKRFDYFNIDDEKAYINETLESMNENCYFGLENASEIPEGHLYAKKIVISCPVDVEVYDKNGNKIYTLYDGKEVDETNDYGRFVCYYDAATTEYVKVICLNDSDEYTLKAVGVDTGTVDIETAVKSGDSIKTAQATGMQIEKSGVITVNLDEQTYTNDINGDGKTETDGKLTEIDTSKVIMPESIKLSSDKLELSVGEKAALGSTFTPADTTFTNLAWSSDNEEVATVKNGCVTAVGAGTATITVTGENNVTATCTVTVEAKKETHEHHYSAHVTKEATCTETGSVTYTCSCGARHTNSIPAKGHTEVSVGATAPTCTKDGLTAGTKCSVCGEVIKAQETVKALGHTAVTDPLVKATRTKDGKTEGSHCSTCGEIIKAQQTIYKASKIKLSKKSYKYNGKKHKPKVIVKDSNGKKISKKNYTVKYSGNRKKVGKYKVNVKFRGTQYKGKKTLYFTVRKK